MNSMREQLCALCDIQDLNSKREELAYKIGNIPKRLIFVNNQIEQLYDNLKIKENLLTSYEKKCHEAENKLELINLNISKSKSKLTQVKNNDQYRASMKEIEVLDEKRDDLENKILEHLESIENIRISISEKRKLLAINKKKLTKEKNSILNEEEKVRKLRDGLEDKIKNIRKSLDPNVLSIFDDLVKRVGNRPIGKVSRSICLGCNMQIPYQMFIELQKVDKLIFCPHCGRIIYKEEDSDTQDITVKVD